MSKINGKSLSLFSALASAAATAYALDYVIHTEWGLSPVTIRRDAIAAAGLLVCATVVKALVRRNKGS
jgi:hypothetical protein